jgi:D-inositol-3-phosphate glycosyltransferase
LPSLLQAFGDGVLDRMAAGAHADAIHANYWLSGVVGHRLKHELDRPLVSTFHTLDRVKAEDSDDADGSRARAEAEVIGCSDAVLASCTVEAAQLTDLYGADPTRIEIVAPAVDHAFFAPGNRAQARRALALPGDKPMLLFVGRIQPLKGLDVAVQTLALADRGAFLVVVGGPSGPEGEQELVRVQGLVADLGLSERVRFVPPQRHELLSTFYRAADVCLVPSRSESFGLVALEAAACGTPVVASAVGGLRTLVDHGRTGFLVEGRDPERFATHTGRILDDPMLGGEMAIEAALRARHYTWPIAAARLRRLYSDLTARQLVECR